MIRSIFSIAQTSNEKGLHASRCTSHSIVLSHLKSAELIVKYLYTHKIKFTGTVNTQKKMLISLRNNQGQANHTKVGRTANQIK